MLVCDSAELRGSEMNDPILMQAGKIGFESNNAGGILGGISTGGAHCLQNCSEADPVHRQAAANGRPCQPAKPCEIEIKGRHDPAIPPRIVPVAESMVALVLADHLLRQRAARL